MALNGVGHVGPMGTALTIMNPARQWNVAIRRVDGNPDTMFGTFHGHSVTETDIKSFLPNWNNLKWSHYAAPLQGLPRESRAEDQPYRVYLIYPDMAGKQPAQIVEEFVADLT